MRSSLNPAVTNRRWRDGCFLLKKKKLKSIYRSRHCLLCCFVSLVVVVHSGFSVKAVTENNDAPGKRKSYLDMTVVHVFDAVLDDNLFFLL